MSATEDDKADVGVTHWLRNAIYRTLTTSNYVSTPSHLRHHDTTNDAKQHSPARITSDDVKCVTGGHAVRYEEEKTLFPGVVASSPVLADEHVVHVIDNDQSLTYDIYSTPSEYDMRNIVRITYQHDADTDIPVPQQPHHQPAQQAAAVTYQWTDVSVNIPIQPPAHPLLSIAIRALSILGLPVPQATPSSISPLVAQLLQGTLDMQCNTLLQPCSGVARSGRLMGIMGSSGSGKTTLLNILSGRGINNTTAKVAGHININHTPITSITTLQQYCSYVSQDDCLPPHSTVREALEFSIRIRQLNHNQPANKYVVHSRVNQVLQQLHLSHCCDRQIGGAMNDGGGGDSAAIGTINSDHGLSGGQVRRASVGIELASNDAAAILFCDEITSGLDSTTAYHMIQALQGVARGGKAVVTTIHSPSNKTFGLLDDVILMCYGCVIYNGTRADMLDWFSGLGYDCPRNTNPAEYVVELLRVETDVDVERVKHLMRARAGQHNIRLGAQPFELPNTRPPVAPSPASAAAAMTFWSWLLQTWLLLAREWQAMCRQPRKLVLRLLQMLGLAIFVGLVYNHTNNTQSSTFARVGYLFFSLCIVALLTVTSTVFEFVHCKPLLLHELVAHNYSVSAYFVTKTILEVPLQLMLTLMFTCTSYYMVGLKAGGGAFAMQWVALMVLSWTCHSVALILGALAPNTFAASVMAPLVIVPFMLFCGFFVNITTIPVYASWLQWLSPHLYIFKAITVNQFADTFIRCTPGELVTATVYTTDYDFCALTSGNDVLNLVSFNGPTASYAFNIGICMVLCVMYRVVAYAALVYVAGKHRQSNHIVAQKQRSIAELWISITDYITAKQMLLYP